MTPPRSTQAARGSHPDLTARTLSGLRWTYLSAAVHAVLQTAYTVTMSRLLEPRVFGIMAVAQLAVNFGQYFAQLGVGRAVIQKKDLQPEHVRASFASGVALGLVAAGVVWVAAPTIGRIVTKPDAVPVLRAMGASFAILGAGMTAQAVLRRALRFRDIALVELIAFAIGYLGVGIPGAVAGWGVWSLVAAVLTTNVLGTGMKLRLARHPVRPLGRWAPYRELYGFGVRTSATQILEYLAQNLDTFAASRYVDASSLGQYNRAFFLVRLPVDYLAQGMAGVLFAGLSRIQDDLERLRRTYRSGLVLVGALFVPIAAGMAVAAPEIVRVVLGPRWDPAAAVVPLVALASAAHVMSRLPAILAEARGQLDRKLAIEVASLLLLATYLAIAIGGPLRAYAAAYAAGELTRHLLYQLVVGRGIGLTARDVPHLYGPLVVTSGVVALAVAGARWGLLAVGAATPVVLVGEVLAGGAGLLLAIRLGPKSVREEMASRLSSAGILGRRRAVDAGARAVLGSAARGQDPTLDDRVPPEVP